MHAKFIAERQGGLPMIINLGNRIVNCWLLPQKNAAEAKTR